MSKIKVLGIIPARFASTRFPGKPLIDIQGQTMLQRVYEQAQKASLLSEVVVATDDQRILEHVQSFGGQVMMTDTNHQSGTDRCAELAAQESDAEIVVNIQGDEPFINPLQIDQVIQVLLDKETLEISTLAKAIYSKTDFLNPNIVKVVFNQEQEALYFSRSPIPYIRDAAQEGFIEGQHYKHIGLYAFRRNTLLALAKLERTALEKMESLEQLRWLDHGYKIGLGITALETIGIDTPEDLEKIIKT